jgi:hypothetical protein
VTYSRHSPFIYLEGLKRIMKDFGQDSRWSCDIRMEYLPNMIQRLHRYTNPLLLRFTQGRQMRPYRVLLKYLAFYSRERNVLFEVCFI